MPRFVPLAACALGLAMIALAVRWQALGRETRGFTRTRGRIVVSRVEETPDLTEHGGPKFRAVLRYAYEARGRSYQSDRVAIGASPGAATSDRGEAHRWVERFPEGSEVDVWLDPRDPSRAVLARGVSRAQVLAALAVGVVLAGLGVFALAR